MTSECPFIAVHLRALALATEVEERVAGALRHACPSGEVTATRTEGHFGTAITILEVELSRSREIREFIDHLGGFGIWAGLAGQAESRVDDARVFHFRLDKQQACLGKPALASGKDVIDVAMKVGVYPASREAAVLAVMNWLGALHDPAGSKIL